MRRVCCAVVAATLLAVMPGTARAQQGGSARVEVSGGARWNGPVSFGTAAANESTPGGGTRPLFTSGTTLDGSIGATVDLGVRIARGLRATVGVAYNPTHLSARISGDVEGVSDVTLRESVTQLVMETGVLAQPRRWAGQRASPFVTGGIGYLRQLNAGRTLVQSGQSAYAGVGLYYVEASARPGRIKATGVRADLRAQVLRGGVAPDHGARVTPAVAVSVFVWF